MDETWKAWWLRALRGGKYKQGRSSLRYRENNCCCLGVLADGLNPKGWKIEDGPFGKRYNMDGMGDYLTKDLRRKAGLSHHSMTRLVRLNDNERWSFAQIADWIEEHL